MLAAKDQYINEASKTIYRLSADEQIRKRCLEREEYYLDKMAMERTMEKQEAEIADQKAEFAVKDAKIAEENAEIADKYVEIQRLRAENEKLKNPDLQIN